MKRIHYIFLIAILLFSCEKPISDFQSKNFIKFFGSGYESKGNDVIELADGGYAITGYDKGANSDQQIYVDRIDKNGNSLWGNKTKTFGVDGYIEEGKIIKEVSDGFVIAGTSKQEGSSITRSFILKVTSVGDFVYLKDVDETANYSIEVKDMIVVNNSIYVVGQCNQASVSKTQIYAAILDLASGVKIKAQLYSNTESYNYYYSKVIQKGNDSLLFVGNWLKNKIAIVSSQPDISIEKSCMPLPAGVTPADAILKENTIYLLANYGQDSTKLLKLDNYIEGWSAPKAIKSIIGKSVAYNQDGTLMICGESTEGENQIINFIKVNTDGTAEYGERFFRTFPGSVGRVIPTEDNGLILIGSTNATYGINIQLIKTDKNYFMFKN
jgi:hypothetical protein